MNKYKWAILLIIIPALFIVEYYLFSDKKYYRKEVNDKNIQNNTVSIAVDQTAAVNKDTITLTWQLLINIDYVDIITEQYPQGVMNPVVNKKIKEMKGRYIKISGYSVPMDENSYALSQNVMASCFFCGMAGPESVMGIEFKNEVPPLETDQFISLVGIFDYNDTNPEDWIYHIRDAELIRSN